MNCFHSFVVISFAVLVGFLRIGYGVRGDERTAETRTRIALGLLDILDNNGTIRRMNLIKTAAVLKGLDSKINEQQIKSLPMTTEETEPDPELLMKSKKREIFGTLYMKYLTFRTLLDMVLCRTYFAYVRKNEEVTTNCTEAMEAIARFYETFQMDESEAKRIFPAISDIIYVMSKNYAHMRELMKEPKFSFPITNLIRNAHKIPNAEEKFQEIMAQKMVAEKRRVNDISSANESRTLIKSEELECITKSSQIAPSNIDAPESQPQITPLSDTVTEKFIENESESTQLEDKSLSESSEFLRAYNLWALEAMNQNEYFLNDKELRERYKQEWADVVGKNKHPRKIEALKRKFRHEAVSGLHKIIWEEALGTFGNYIPTVENFFNETLNRRETVVTSIHDMIPREIKECIPYWTYIARQAKVLQSSSNPEDDLKKMRSYIMEAETQKRQTLNYEKAPVAKTTILFEAKRFSDFTVSF